MGPKLSCGLYIPNADFAWKFQSVGPIGLPDGWTASAQAVTDLTTPQRVQWVPNLIGGGLLLGRAHVHGSGRALRVVAPSTLASNAARYLLSPSGTHGQLPFYEPSSMAYMAAESTNWWARIRLRAFLGTVAPTVDWTLNLRQLSEAESTDNSVGSLTIPAASWTGAWVDIVSAPMAIVLSTANGLDHVRVRIIVQSGPAAGSAIAVFDGFTVETLGPIDFAEQTAGEGATLAGADHETFYEFAKAPQHAGAVFGQPRTLAKVTELPSGARFSYDPSGGVTRRTFELPYRFLKGPDEERLRRLWRANKGMGGSAGEVSYGRGVPLVIAPVAPYYSRPAYVDFATETYPLEIDGGFQEATAATALWRGTVALTEV